jgi:stage II sporulation protein R
MDGVFMKKWIKRSCILALILSIFWCGGLIGDKMTLKENLIRLHIVANSDSQEDQELKLQIRDAVMEKLQPLMENIPDAQQAKAYLQNRLPELERYINDVLKKLGSAYTATVTLEKEAFDLRKYDTFSLPSGVYESLRVTIGEGQGKNWWCVIFPGLCTPKPMDDVAAGAGFSQRLTDTLENRNGYQPRFFLLDCIGKLENLLFRWN